MKNNKIILSTSNCLATVTCMKIVGKPIPMMRLEDRRQRMDQGYTGRPHNNNIVILPTDYCEHHPTK